NAWRVNKVGSRRGPTCSSFRTRVSKEAAMRPSHAHKLVVATVMVVALAGAGRASAATVTVPNNGDPSVAGDALAAAVKDAGAGDTIVLSPGDYNLRSTLELTKNITIQGPSTPPGARLDGGGLSGSGSFTGGRYDLVAVGDGAQVKLQYLNLIGTGTNG